jgi:hypothetical protein
MRRLDAIIERCVDGVASRVRRAGASRRAADAATAIADR